MGMQAIGAQHPRRYLPAPHATHTLHEAVGAATAAAPSHVRQLNAPLTHKIDARDVQHPVPELGTHLRGRRARASAA